MAPDSSLGSVVSWEEDDRDGEARAVLGHSTSPTIDASLGAGMVGGVKAVILLLALVLIAGGAASSSTTDKHPEHVPYQHSHDSHPSHHQAPPLLEMLPPIGPIGIVAIGVMGDYYLSRYDHDGHGDDHDGHHHGGEGGVDHNPPQP